MNSRHSNDLTLFNEALEIAAPEARAAYLDRACGADAALRRKIDSLLAAYEKASDRFEDLDRSLPTLVPETTRDLEGPGSVIGRYKLLQKIGEGGCGVVYLAEQEEPVRRRVALKVIKLGMDTKSVIARFEAERQALALMDHPNIAKVLDVGATDAGRPYFVMELVRGVKITDYCDNAKLSTRDRLDLFIKVCQAIQHAHQKGIIHRDIKPSNILVTLHDGVPVAKVIDFGIAKATSDQRLTDKTLFTALDQFIGTPAYMSPEQAEMSGLDIDTRCDIYSLGVLLYEMLTTKTPFDAKELLVSGLDEMRRTIREKEPVRPSTKLSQTLVAENVSSLQAPTNGKPVTEEEIRASSRRLLQLKETIALLRGDVDWIVMKCLEKDRARRYETANGLATDIKRFLNQEPIMARPPSTAYRLQKAFRRHKLAFVSAAAIGVVLVPGVIVSTWEAFEASKARDSEKKQRLAAQRAQEAEKQERLRTDAERIIAQRHLYVANMNLAQQAWELSNVDGLRQLLVDTKESPYRGFEWDYWQRQSHLAWKTFRGHLLKVNSVAFSPDGQRIVTGSEDQIAKVWEVASGRELFSLKEHSAPIFCVAFSPDGRRLVTSSGDQTAKVWDAANGRPLLTLKGHKAGIRAVAFSSDGQRIVTGGGDEMAKVWDAASGLELGTLKGDGYQILSVAFSPDGQRIVTGTRDRSAKVWDAASGVKLLTLNRHSAGITSVAFSRDGHRILTGSSDGTAKVWDAASGAPLLTLAGQNVPGLSAAFSPDGQLIATSSDKIAKVWDATSGRPLLTLKGHSAPITAVVFSLGGERIVTGSVDQSAKVWELPTLKEHSAPIMVMAFSPNAERTVTSSGERTATVWDAANGRELHTLWHSAGIRSLAFSPDGQRIVTGSEDQTAKVWDAASGRELLTLNGHRARILCVAFSTDGHRIVTSSWDQTAKVWDAVNGRDLRTLKGHSAPIGSAAFSPDGQRIVTGSEDQTAKVWDAASGRELLTFNGHKAQVLSVAFSPDAERIITGSQDQTAKVWEATSGRELFTLTGHSAWIGSVAFSPDAQRIVTGGYDKTAKVWEAASGRELLTLTGYIGGVRPMAFSPDGQRIVTSSLDQTAKVWQAAPAEQVAAWEEEEWAAAQYLAALQRERTAEQEPQRIARACDEGAIKRWLILGPIVLAIGQSEAEGLDTEQIEGEGWLRPKAGEAAVVASGALKWEEVGLKDYMIDFNEILRHLPTARSVAYAVCYIRSDAEQRGLQMLVGSNDQSKVYLNGKQVHKYRFPRGFVADQDRVPGIVLNAGQNVVVFKVVNEMFDWIGSIRFTDPQGNPVKGIKGTLDPEAKERRESKQP